MREEEAQIKLWRLDPERAAEWRDIRLTGLRESPEAFDSIYADWRDRPLADFAQRLEVMRTFAAGRKIGQPLAVAGWQAGLDPRDPQRAWLLSVYSRDEARGQGFAAMVCRAVIEDAAAAGMVSMGLHVLGSNLAAQVFYQHLGFDMTGRGDVFNTRGEPEAVMVLRKLSGHV